MNDYDLYTSDRRDFFGISKYKWLISINVLVYSDNLKVYFPIKEWKDVVRLYSKSRLLLNAVELNLKFNVRLQIIPTTFSCACLIFRVVMFRKCFMKLHSWWFTRCKFLRSIVSFLLRSKQNWIRSSGFSGFLFWWLLVFIWLTLATIALAYNGITTFSTIN